MRRTQEEQKVVQACQSLWRELRSGDVAAVRNTMAPGFDAQGFPIPEASEGGPSEATDPVACLIDYYREGGGLTNVVYQVGGALAQRGFGTAQVGWMAERGLGTHGSPSYVSGQVTVTFAFDADRWLACGWLGMEGVHAARCAEDRGADLAAIREQILRVFEAYRQKDQAMLRRTHTADWRGFALTSGSIGRGIEAYMGAAKRSMVSMHFEDYRILELDAVFYGDLAIVPYVAVVVGKSAQGRIQESRLRVIDVYLREPSGWNQVASNVCLHPEEIRAV
jgi:ketosteroid isomerase-like protein